MEYKVYNVIAERVEDKTDMDCVSYKSYETFFNDFFPSKVSAIRKAQRLASKSNCYVRVVLVNITERGMEREKIIYGKYITTSSCKC